MVSATEVGVDAVYTDAPIDPANAVNWICLGVSWRWFTASLMAALSPVSPGLKASPGLWRPCSA